MATTTATHPEAFVLLHIPEVRLTVGNTSESGTLALECVTLAPNDDDKSAPLAASLSSEDRSLYLVLRLNSLELPLDPTRPISVSIDRDGGRTYTFQSAESAGETTPSPIRLTIPVPLRPDTHRAETIEAFDHILTQYAEVEGLTPEPHTPEQNQGEPQGGAEPVAAGQGEDLRGKLVLMDEESGEVVGELPNRVHITEDPALAKAEKGKDGEPAPVLLELPPDVYDAYTGQGTSVVPYHEPGSDLEEAREIFVRAIPPEDQDWITKSATFISQAITSSTSMLLKGLTSAAHYYISHSTPSPHASGSATPNAPRDPNAAPPRALLLLSHPRTHATLSRAYAISGQAVKVSQKTVGIVENMIKRAVGGRDKPTTGTLALAPRTVPPAPSAPAAEVSSSVAMSPASSVSEAPPPYPGSSTSHWVDGKPPLPARQNVPPPLPPRSRSRSPSSTGEKSAGTPSQLTSRPVPPPPPPRPAAPAAPAAPQPATGATTPPPPPPPRPLKTTEKLLLSANLVLATVDDSAKRVFDAGSTQITAAVAHKYGPEAGKSAHLATHTARNVTLVYIDMQGLARRALIRKAGKEWVKARVGSRRAQQQAAQMDGLVVDKQSEEPK